MPYSLPPSLHKFVGCGGGHSARSPEQELAKMLGARQQNQRARFVVFSGHVHNYERHEHGGVTYFVTGGAGAHAYPIGVEGAHGFLGVPYAFALKKGARIGTSDPFSGKLMLYSGMRYEGRWHNLSGRYLGLRYQMNGATHYGWARFGVGVFSGPKIIAHLTGFAYETTANMPIVAGQTSYDESSESVSPSRMFDDDLTRSASLGLLALGSEAIPLLRSN